MSTTSTTPIEFTVEDGEYRYTGVAACIYHRGSHGQYTSHGWVQGDPPYVEAVDVVLFKVERDCWGFWLKVEMTDEAEGLAKLDAVKCVNNDEDWQVKALENF